MFVRPVHDLLAGRLGGMAQRIQILAGPRQVGKTTLVEQLRDRRDLRSSLYASADVSIVGVQADWLPSASEVASLPGAPADTRWLEDTWNKGMAMAAAWAKADETQPFVLIVDEVQKIPNWSAVVKALWDKGQALQVPMQVVLLGSAPLLINRGLTDSLAGRYEQIRMTHWSFEEMSAGFGLDLEQYVYFGGSPGSAPFIGDEPRWRNYVNDSLIFPNVERDILQMERIEKPALLKQLFLMGCAYSGQIVSLDKLKGQLEGAGNVTTLARYLDLLQQAGLLAGIQKYSGDQMRQRKSPPKLHALNSAFISATVGMSFAQAIADRSHWGRLVESSVGAHLINTAATGTDVFYWRDGIHEVDFVIRRGGQLALIEIKSGKLGRPDKAAAAFMELHGPCKSLVVGRGHIELGEFLRYPADHWID